MSNILTIKVDGRTFEFKKNEIVFKHGFGLIEKYVEYNYKTIFGPDGTTLRAVVNEDYEVILEPRGYYDEIDVFENNNFIVKVRVGDEHSHHIENRHFRYENKEMKQIRVISDWDYKRLSDSLILTKSGWNALYDMNKADFISPKFSMIENFEKNGDIETAKATLNFKIGNTKKCETGVCLIDKDGQIRTPFYVAAIDETFPLNQENFDEVVPVIKNCLNNFHKHNANKTEEMLKLVR